MGRGDSEPVLPHGTPDDDIKGEHEGDDEKDGGVGDQLAQPTAKTQEIPGGKEAKKNVDGANDDKKHDIKIGFEHHPPDFEENEHNEDGGDEEKESDNGSSESNYNSAKDTGGSCDGVDVQNGPPADEVIVNHLGKIGSGKPSDNIDGVTTGKNSYGTHES